MAPSAESTRSTLAAATLPENLRLFFSDPAGEEAYPIVTFSWILLYQEYPEQAKADALRKLFTWCLKEGQADAPALGYLALPDEVVARSLAAVESVAR